MGVLTARHRLDHLATTQELISPSSSLLFHPALIRYSPFADHLQVSNGDLNLDTGLDGDGGDLLDHVSGGVQVDQALVDAASRRGGSKKRRA